MTMRGLAQAIVRAAALAMLIAPAAACDASPPAATARPAAPLELTGRVVDAADILPPEVESQLDRRLAAIERDTRAQLVVVSTPDLKGMAIEDYGLQLGRGWGIGDAKRNDGVLLIVAPNERKVRIEVGYGLENTLKDELCAGIIADDILPRFRQGDLPGGTIAGAEALERLLRNRTDTSA
jgi:uncharacterized protein